MIKFILEISAKHLILDHMYKTPATVTGLGEGVEHTIEWFGRGRDGANITEIWPIGTLAPIF